MGSLSTIETGYGGGDYTWLQSARDTEFPESGTADTSTFNAEDDYPNGYLPSGLPLAFNAGTGLYGKAATTDTVDTIAGFVWHNVPTHGAANVTIAVIKDATIVAANVPGVHDLVDGRYICDHVNDADTVSEGP